MLSSRVPLPLLQRVALIAAMTACLSCGADGELPGISVAQNDRSHGGGDGDAEALAIQDPAVRACGVPAPAPAPAALGFSLVGETYAADIVPIVTQRCLVCHAGDQAGRQNSTTCGFLENNIDQVITRFENNIRAYICDSETRAAVTDFVAANGTITPDPSRPCYEVRNANTTVTPVTANRLSANEIRNWVSSGNFNDATQYDKYPMPPYDNNLNNVGRQITRAEVDVFTAWKAVPDKCVDTSTPDAPLPDSTAYTDDDDLQAKQAKLFEGETCEDGPAVVGDRPYVEAILALPPDSPSAFYDYEAKAFVEGARKIDGNCTIDYFMEALAVVPGAQDALKAYKSYGWWVTQCAIVDGRPQAYLAHVARVTTALGDKTYGAFLKLLKITDQ